MAYGTRLIATALLLSLPGLAHAQTVPVATRGAPATVAATSLPTAAPATPAEPTTKAKKPPSPKQLAAYERMRRCNAEAREKDLHGDPRKAFMKGCLSTQGAPNT